MEDVTPTPAFSFTPRVCSTCGQPGHFRRNCPHYNETCKACLRPGHVASICRDRRAVCQLREHPGHNANECSKSGYTTVMSLVRDSSSLLEFLASIGNNLGRALIDSGAGINVINEKTAKSLQLPIYNSASKLQVSMADGSQRSCETMTEVLINIGGEEML